MVISPELADVLATILRRVRDHDGAANLLIEKIRRVGHGHRNFTSYRLRLLLHCGIARDKVLTPRIRTRPTTHSCVEPDTQ